MTSHSEKRLADFRYMGIPVVIDPDMPEQQIKVVQIGPPPEFAPAVTDPYERWRRWCCH